MVYQDVRRNAMQASNNYKASYDKKTDALQLKQLEYVYVSQPKADHQRSKKLLTDFRRMGPYIIEKVLPNNKSLVGKIDTDKVQVLHRMRLRHVTRRQPPPDVQITPKN